MIAQEITDSITPIIIYLQECEKNMTLRTIILMLTYNTYASLLHMVIFLKHLQSLTNHPMAMLTPYIKATNALFCQLILLLPFELRIYVRLQKNLMSNLLHSL